MGGWLLTKPTETCESDGKNNSSQNEKDVAEPNCKKKNIKDTVSYRSTKLEDCIPESFLQGITSPLITLLCNDTVDFSVSFPARMNLNKVLLKQLT